MSYQLASIGRIVTEAINVNWFLPTIQRPYVWGADAIESLLESVMRGYPIGSLMVWSVPPERVDHWDCYAFEAHIRQQNLVRKPVGRLPTTGLVQVLDGQQRLTSLLVTLTGSYAPLKKGRKVAPSYNEVPMTLYLDLLHRPKSGCDGDDEPVDEILQKHYRLKFFAGSAPIKLDEFWFPVRSIMSVRDEFAFERLAEEHVERSAALTADEKELARITLRRLWECVWLEYNLAYFVDSSNSPDRVVDIFIKANDTGKKLSRQDLLVSVMSVRWEQVNIQEGIVEICSMLTDRLRPVQPPRLDFVVNLTLYLNGLDLKAPIADFTPANIRRMESTWADFKHSLAYTCDWLAQHGFSGEALGSMNMVMLLTWYLHHSGVSRGEHRLGPDEEEAMRQWLIKAQFLKFWQNQSKNVLLALRSVLKRHLISSMDFPSEILDRELMAMGRMVAMDESWVARLCETPVAAKNGPHLLSLVYQRDLSDKGLRIVPLVKQAHWREQVLLDAGFPASETHELLAMLETVGMAVALDEREFEHYSQLGFEDWAATLRGDQLSIHLLPNVSILRLDHLRELASERQRLIARRLVLARHPQYDAEGGSTKRPDSPDHHPDHRLSVAVNRPVFVGDALP